MAGDRTILDAGPCLTFCAAHAERILVQAIRRQLIHDRGEMRKLYTRMRLLDDGLVDITQTCLLDARTWNLHSP